MTPRTEPLFDRRISWGNLLTVLALGVGALAAFFRLEAASDVLKHDVTALDARLTALTRTANERMDRLERALHDAVLAGSAREARTDAMLARIEERLAAQQELLRRIAAIVDPPPRVP
jgi:hypothetical protein